MSLMGKKMSAATALEGRFSTEGLVAMAGEDNAQMALARSLSDRIEDVQRAWGKMTGSGPIIRPIIPFDSLSDASKLLLATVLEPEEEIDTIPMLSQRALATILLRLHQAGLSLD